MRIAVVHLSDIHLRAGANPVVDRIEQLTAAMTSVEPAATLYVLLVSGDIANWGLVTEYVVAKNFFNELCTRLRNSESKPQVELITIPGNHDCVLPKEDRALRDALIQGLLPSLQQPAPDPALLKQVLKIQDNYSEFQQETQSNTRDCICSTVFIEYCGIRIQLNLYNTAVLSTREEQQAQLRVPIKYINERIFLDRTAALAISSFHHSYLWLESNIAMEFRSHIERTCDIAFTGHQHYPHDYYKVNLTGEQVLYIEAPALQDENYPQTSAFRVLVFDFEGNRERSFHFRWSSTIYKRIDEGEWRTLTINRGVRAEFRFKPTFEKTLRDPGSPYYHQRKDSLTLRDIFVYPELTVSTRIESRTAREIAGTRVVDYVLSAKRVVFQSGGMGGKTALAKVLCEDLLRAGLIPVYLNGFKVAAAPEDKVVSSFWRLFQDQYEGDLLEEFQQSVTTRGVLLIDDWNSVGMNSDGRKIFLNIASQYFSKILLFVDEMFQIQELLEGSPETLLTYDSATIKEFGHELRGQLIDKWLKLGREHTVSAGALSREIEETESIIISVVGKSTLPSLPFIILGVLEANEDGKAESEAGSFGFLYEVLVTRALNASKGPRTQLEKKYIFLAKLAYRMFKEDTFVLPTADVRKVAQDYSIEHLVNVDIDLMLDDLLEVRVLCETDGHWRFTYPHLYQYFVARYYRDNLDTSNGDMLRAEIDSMVDRVSSGRYAAILTFIIYFAKDTTRLVKKLASRADAIYPSEPAARFETDIAFINQMDGAASVHIDEQINIEENRNKRRELRDRIAKSAESGTRHEDREFAYSDNLPDADKFNLAYRHIELLGQVIRNFPGSLPGEEKLDILTSCYSLGLRLLGTVFKLLESSVEQYRTTLVETIRNARGIGDSVEESTHNIERIKALADWLIALLSRICAIVILHKVASNVGVADLEQAYSETLERVGRSNATELINIIIEMEHSPEFPLAHVLGLSKRLAKNPFVHAILGDFVSGHLSVYDAGRRVRQAMAAEFNFKANTKALIEPTRKA